MEVFSVTPSFPATESSAPRVNRFTVPSYEQRAILGINPMVDTWQLTFAGRTPGERNEIYNFLLARRGVEAFQWTTPFGQTAAFVCPTFDLSLEQCDYGSVTATFELQYVPGGPNLSTPAAPTTAFNIAPDFTADLSWDGRGNVMQLGDGYRQRVTFGAYPWEETWRLQFLDRTNAERDTIREYLRGARGVTGFSWTDPRSGNVGKYVCSEWNVTYNRFNGNDITATFRRVFEVGTDLSVNAPGANLPITFTLSAGAATGFSDYWNDVTALRSINYGFTEALTTPSGTFPGSSGTFRGAVLMQDGRVFCVPASSSTARIYNPVTNTLITPSGAYPGGSVESFNGGVLLTDGRVFCVPWSSATARIYNPVTDTVITPNVTFPNGFRGTACLLRDGRVFCLDDNLGLSRIYDPVADTLTNVPGTVRGFGCVLMQDGRVYCVPNGTTASIYDPVTNTVTTAGGTYPSSGFGGSGTLLPDGRIFIVPRASTTARIYNPATNTLTTPGGTYPYNSVFNEPQYIGGVLLPDGRVFCVPHRMSGSNNTARIYNPVTDAVTVAAGTYPAGFILFGGVLMFDGRVYCVPYQNTTARIFGTALAQPLPANRVLNPHDNRL